MDDHAVASRTTEPTQPSLLSLMLGATAVIPLILGAAAAWLLAGPWREVAADSTVLWGGSILTFLAGVRRGVSFRTPGGPRVGQIVAMLWLYGIGLGALAVFVLGAATVQPGRTIAAILLLLIGYASLVVIDPAAAKRGEAPRFFARLRPVQMIVAVAALLALLLQRLVE